MPAYNSLPGSPLIYKVGKDSYVVYTIPGSKPPIRMAWKIPNDKTLQSYYGPDQDIEYDKEITKQQWKEMGILSFGSSIQLSNLDKHPFLGWVDTMKTQAAVQPWILDRDYQMLIAEATLEGRQLTEAEIQGTEWWKSHNEAQREWMKLWHGDRQTAEQLIDDNRIRALQLLKDAGVNNPNESLVNFIADQVTKGNWSTVKMQQQIKAISDPASGIELAGGVAKRMGGQDTTRGEEDTVVDLAREWLGPAFGVLTEKQIKKWSGILRNDPDGEVRFTNFLKNQRLSLFPQYEDASLTYEDIASPWRSMVTQMWGTELDETKPMFLKMLENNDAAENAKMLRHRGLKQGNQTVLNSANQSILASVGGTVRQAL